METGKTIAVVTGASCGMGTEFVRQIGEQKPFIEEVWAIARNREALEKLQREVSKVRVFALDITSPKDLDTLAAALRQERPRIAWLVCSAGAGVQKTVEETGLSDLQNMIELNCTALTAVTKLCLPYCKRGTFFYWPAARLLCRSRVLRFMRLQKLMYSALPGL